MYKQRPLLLPGNLEMPSLSSGVQTSYLTAYQPRQRKSPCFMHILPDVSDHCIITRSLVLTLAQLKLNTGWDQQCQHKKPDLSISRSLLTLLPPASVSSEERPLPDSGGSRHFLSTLWLAFLCMSCDLLIKLSNFCSHRKVTRLALTFP